MKGQLAVSTPKQYLAKLTGPRKADVTALDRLIRKAAPALKPFIHDGLLAYGRQRLKYASGRELDWFRLGVASNASYISLYVLAVEDGQYVTERFKRRLPKAKIGKSCVRFKKLEDVDLGALAELIQSA